MVDEIKPMNKMERATLSALLGVDYETSEELVLQRLLVNASDGDIAADAYKWAYDRAEKAETELKDLVTGLNALVASSSPPEGIEYWHTVATAAIAMEISEGAVRQNLASGRFCGVKVRGSWHIDPQSVSSYDPSKKRGPVPKGKG